MFANTTGFIQGRKLIWDSIEVQGVVGACRIALALYGVYGGGGDVGRKEGKCNLFALQCTLQQGSLRTLVPNNYFSDPDGLGPLTPYINI